MRRLLPGSVWVEGTINSLMAKHRMINISHKAVSVWDWPEMTMDFKVAKDVDFASLKAGMTLQVEITKTQDGKYQISKIHIPGADDANKNLDDLNMDDMNLDDMSLDKKKPTDHKQ